MTSEIFPETATDRQAIWGVHQAAFESEAEANLVDALRSGGYVAVSLVAKQQGSTVGHILFSHLPIMTDSGTVETVSLAPMAVLPRYQSQGIGSRLVGAGLEACRIQGHKIAVVLGHPEFYPRFGFSARQAQPLESPFGGGKAWMAMELVAGALTGVTGRVAYPPPFTAFD